MCLRTSVCFVQEHAFDMFDTCFDTYSFDYQFVSITDMLFMFILFFDICFRSLQDQSPVGKEGFAAAAPDWPTFPCDANN